MIVEFALTMPLMLLFFAIMMESARTAWAYQMVNSGVRDASRYVARVAPRDICSTGGNLNGYTTQVTNIVTQNRAGLGVMPATVVVNSVTPSLTCVTGSYRNGPVGVATVSANITVQYPMGFIFDWFGDAVGQATTVVADDARIFGQ